MADKLEGFQKQIAGSDKLTEEELSELTAVARWGHFLEGDVKSLKSKLCKVVSAPDAAACAVEVQRRQ